MLRFNKAVTLAEMMIVFVIIGVIATVGLSTVKPYEKTFKYLYVRIFNALETASYNGMMDRTNFPQTTAEFCKMIANEKGNTQAQGYINVSYLNCDAPDVSASNPNFNEQNLKMVATNGMRFWIASNGGAPYVLSTAKQDVKYYIVFVDINGTKGPNSTEWVENGKLADIVCLIVTDNSIVIPIGPPEIDTRYMLASAIYPPNDENDPEGNRSAPTSYYQAKLLAWGNSVAVEEVRSLNFALTSTFGANSPFLVQSPPVDGTNIKGVHTEMNGDVNMGCTEENGVISPCYVKIEEYN